MTDTQMRSETNANAERSAAAAKRNDLPAEAERRSFREPAAGSASAAARMGAFEQVRRDLEQIGARAGYWGPHLLSRQFDPILRMQTDMIRWFDEAWREAGAAWQPFQRLNAFGAAPLFGLPPADVHETDGAYKLAVELPGLKREDVDVAIDGDMLMISGRKQEDHQEAGTTYRLNERRFGRFERSFPLPPDVRREGVAAAFHDGVLTITLPKAGQQAQDKRSKIEIRS